MDNFTPRLEKFRFYNDGTESGSSPKAAEDVAADLDTSSAGSQIHLRVSIEEVGSGSLGGDATDDYSIQFDHNGADDWATVTLGSSPVHMDTGSSLTDFGASTNRATNGISDGAGSFVVGEQRDSGGAVNDHELTANNFTEHVFAFGVFESATSDGDTIDFRMRLNGGNMSSNIVPRININKGGGGTNNFETVVGALTFAGAATRASGSFSRTVTGALSFAGAAVKKAFKATAGAISFVGSVTTLTIFTRAVSGALTFAGAVLKTIKKPTAGVLSFIGTLTKVITFKRTVTGAITFSGNAAKKLFEAVAGALSFVGTATRVVTFARTITGVLTFSGAASTLKTFRRAVDGTLTFVGTAVRASGLFFRTVTGNLSFVGTATKKLFEAIGGALSFIGTATRTVTFSRVVTGAITFVGGATKKALKALAGAVSFVGDLVAAKLGAIPQAVGGAISFVGDVATLVTFKRVVAGAIAFIGIATRASGAFSRTVTGAFTSSGVALKKTLKATAGAISFVGIATRMVTFARSFAGAITFSGAASTLATFRRVVAGALTFVGTVTKKVSKAIAGVLTFIGAVVPVLSGIVTQAVGGALSFIGDVSKKTLKPLAGVLTFAGAITKVLTRLRTVVGALTFSGIATKVSTFKRTVTGALTFIGTATRKTLKALGGAITFSGVATRASAVFHRTLTGSLSFIGTIGTKALETIVGVLSFIGTLVANFVQGGIADLTGPLIPSTGWVLSPAANVTWRDIASEALRGGRYIELRTELNRTDGGLNGTGQAVTSNRIKMDVVPGQRLYFRCGLRWKKLPGANNDPASELRVTLGDGVMVSTLIKVGDTLPNADGWSLVTAVLVLQGAASEFDLTFTITPKNALATPYLEAWGIDVVELYREPT